MRSEFTALKIHAVSRSN